MGDLLSTQRAFANSLADASQTMAAAQWITGDPALVARRLAIYRGNLAAAYAKALAAAYPVVEQLVGHEFFGGLARAYARAHPSSSGDLFDFGQDFASFLQTFEHAQSLAYLPDLARLEWRVHRAYGAHDADTFDIDALATVPPGQQGAICFRWAAGTALIVSNHPIVQLWQIHQPGFEGRFAVEWSAGEIACIARHGFNVVVTAIGAAEAAFVDASLAGASLGLAAEAALAADPAFDPAPLLQRAIACKLITGFTLTDSESNS